MQLYHCPPDLVFSVKGRIREWSREKLYMTPVSIEIQGETDSRLAQLIVE